MRKGGRCSGVAAMAANLLQLKPGLEMKDGKLGVYKKYRGSIEHVYKQYITERLKGKNVRPGHVFLTESGEIDPAVVEDLIKLVYALSGCREVHHTLAGCTVSTHCGPKTLGVLFIEE
jgi:fatty acid-binding protein DegV